MVGAGEDAELLHQTTAATLTAKESAELGRRISVHTRLTRLRDLMYQSAEISKKMQSRKTA
jgi:hypothetical protein